MLVGVVGTPGPALCACGVAFGWNAVIPAAAPDGLDAFCAACAAAALGKPIAAAWRIFAYSSSTGCRHCGGCSAKRTVERRFESRHFRICAIWGGCGGMGGSGFARALMTAIW